MQVYCTEFIKTSAVISVLFIAYGSVLEMDI
jgi:hypothetical protein